MIRRLGLASLLVVVCAFGGASAGPFSALPNRRVLVTIAWLDVSEQVERESDPFAGRVTPPRVASGSTSPRPVGLRRFTAERWLFQRPPPTVL
jgi:hypothetical protein